VARRAEFLERRYLDGIDGSFDLLISNPPYIESREIARLDPEVRDFDPLAALDGGADGLDAYRELAAGLNRVVPEGWGLFEVGAGQAPAVAGLLRHHASGAVTIVSRTWNDLGGHERCVAIKTQSYP